MGVHGLWKLLEPSGEPVALEALENKVLAIDVSMWLHQVLKGYHDASGNAIPNAHLIGLFHRICKLMYFGIKPVFVFDGGVPMLKQQTMINRKRQKKTAGKRAQDERMRLLRNLMEQDILQRVRGNTTGTALLKMPSRKDEVPSLFELPQDEPDALRKSDAEGNDTETSDDDIEEIINWDNFDPNSREFKMLPALKRLEILNNLKESRKQGSWRRMHDMPQESGDFSSFQMKRLLVRRSAQVEMEEAEKELSKSHTLSLQEIKAIMAEKGSLATKLCEMDVDYGSRIASDNTTRLIMISNPTKTDTKLAIEEDTIFVAEPAIKVKVEIPERLEEDVSGTDKSNIEIPEIVVSDDELDRSFVEQMFVSNIEHQVNKSDLTQEEILALIENGMSEDTRKHDYQEIVDFNQPSTSKAAFNFVPQINLDKEDEPSSKPQQCQPSETLKSAVNHSAAAELLKLLTSSNEPETTKVIDTPASPVVGDISEVIPVKKPLDGFTTNYQASSKEEASVDKLADPEAVPQEKSAIVPSDATEKKEESLEINIKPEEVSQEDDLFSGVFSAPDETESIVPSPASAIGIMSCSEESSCELESGVESPAISEVPVEEPEEEQQVDNEDLPPPKTDFRSMSITDEEMKLIEERLAKEQASIVSEIGRQERIATNLSNQICNEAQELIALFGLPFVVAPMEAEAQCAMLDLLSLTNGTVTDDSDIWLFGGRTVYRNFFNQAKNVERYTSESISKNFKLSRDRLILLAMLVGSDYTIGLQGVGPVTALEIIAEFATNRIEEIGDPEELVIPLKRFRQWWQSKEMTNLRRKRLKNSLKELHFHEGFPSEAVVDAYVHPQVSDSKDKFSWDKPNIDGLVEYSNLKFGWSKSHAESVLDPVIKRQGETKVQGRIDSYFNVQAKAKELDDLQLSSRVRKAVTQLDTASQSDDEVVEPQPSTSKRAQNEAAKEAPKPKRGKKIQSSSKLNEFKQQFTKKPKPLKEAAVELKPKSSATVPKLEKIPQREKNKETALQSKLKAIEIFRKRKIDPVVKSHRPKRVVAKDDHLSESSESD